MFILQQMYHYNASGLQLIIFQTQLLETLDTIRLNHCSMEAEQICRVVGTIDFLQTCVESIVDKVRV